MRDRELQAAGVDWTEVLVTKAKTAQARWVAALLERLTVGSHTITTDLR